MKKIAFLMTLLLAVNSFAVEDFCDYLDQKVVESLTMGISASRLEEVDNKSQQLKSKIDSLIHFSRGAMAQELLDKYCDRAADELILMLPSDRRQKLNLFIDSLFF